MDLAPYIRELLLNHECFILPDFGGFETSYSPAQYDNDNKQMLPPSKKILFKSEYKVGGEVLEKHLVKKLSIDSNDSKLLIKDYIQNLKSKLRNQEQVLIDGVGIFYPDYTGKPNFEAFKNENYLVDSFGLDALSFSQPQNKNSNENQKIQIKEIAARNTTLTFVIIGVILISILMAVTIILSARFDIYLFNIGDKSASGSEKIIIGGRTNPKNNTVAIEDQIESHTSIKNALSIGPQDSKKQPEAKTTEYLLVVGSYKNIKNANELMSRLSAEGYNANIVKSDNNYRVCVGQFNDKVQATKELNRIRRQINHSVWILTKSD